MITAFFADGPLKRQKRKMLGYPTFRIIREGGDPNLLDVYVRTTRTTPAGAVIYELGF
jgi:hypothetical protein